MAVFFNGGVNTNSPLKASPTRYVSLRLQDAEPNLGAPEEDGFMLISNALGARSWAPSAFSPDLFIGKDIISNKGDIIVGLGADDPTVISVGADGQILVADSGEPTGIRWQDPVANIPESIIEAKGDLIVGESSDTPAVLPVGNDGDILVADSAEDLGIKWETPVANIPESIIEAKGDLIVGESSDVPAVLPVGSDGDILVVDSTEDLGVKWETPTANIPESLIDAKGDLIVGESSDVPAVLPVGNDGDVLVADSAEDLGVKWVAPTGTGEFSTLSLTTDVINAGEIASFALSTPASYQVFSVSTNAPAWVRVYGSAFGRDTDARTQPGAPFPDPGSGFFLEIESTIHQLDTFLSPTVEIQAETTETFFTVKNTTGSPAAITVVLEVLENIPARLPESPPYGCNIQVNTSGQTDLSNAWANCASITRLPLLDLSIVTDLESAWEGCSALAFVPQGLFDNCPCTNFTNTFVDCALTADSVDNILVSLDNAGETNGTVDITGGLSYPPSVIGLAAKANLEGKGWTVNVVSGGTVSFVDMGEPIYSLASFRDGGVFAGGDSGAVYASTDYGINFGLGTPVGAGIIRSLAACDVDTVIAGTWNDSFFFISTDRGATWGPGEDFNNSEIDSIVYAGSGVIYIGTFGYVHKSVDNGATWLPQFEPEPLGDYYVSSAIAGPNSIVLGTYSDGYIAYSSDGGTTWDTTANGVLDGNAPISGLASNGAGVVVAGTYSDNRVFRSLDSGVTWDLGYALGDGSIDIRCLICSETGVFYAGTEGGDSGKIYRSLDSGATWEEFFNPSIPSSYVNSLAIGGNGTLIASIETFVYSIPYSYSSTNYHITQLYPSFTSTPPNLVKSDPAGVVGATSINNIIALSQADYDNIVAPNPETLYIITA